MSPNPNNCEDMPGWHRFFQTNAVTKFADGSPSLRATNEGVRVVCAICGEIREVWNNGQIDIIKLNPHAQTNNPEN